MVIKASRLIGRVSAADVPRKVNIILNRIQLASESKGLDESERPNLYSEKLTV
jgi:hypothetical protein